MSIDCCIRSMGSIRSAILLPALILVVGACKDRQPSIETGDAPAQDLPGVKELVNRHIEAIGGRDALERVATRRETARNTYSFDKTLIANSTEEVSGNRRVWDWRYSDGSHVRSGFDGETAWHIKDDNAVVMTGEDHDRTAYFSRLDHFLKWDSLHREANVTEVQNFYGVECYAVDAVTHTDFAIRFFFEIDSGLLRGVAYSEPGRNGRINIERLLSDYRPVGDIRIAHKGDAFYRESRTGKQWRTSAVTKSIQVNVSFADEHFDLPPNVLRGVDKDRGNQSDHVAD